MKTNILEKNTIEAVKLDLTTNNVVELSNHYSIFINDIKNLLNIKYKENDLFINKYRLINDIVETLNPVILKNSGICNIKRFKRYLRLAIKIKSLYSINKLLNLVHKRILKLEHIPKIVCDKHEMIQLYRKEWLKQQKIADKLLNDYKKEKGDFYKN